jgi:hypothetical protein
MVSRAWGAHAAAGISGFAGGAVFWPVAYFVRADEVIE